MAEVGFGSIGTSSTVTADGVIGTSGINTVVWSLIIKGGSATTRCVLEEGAGSGATMADIIAPINDTVTVSFPHGLYCSDGAYVDITTTAGSVTVVYSQA
jgi:hypothetical protein